MSRVRVHCSPGSLLPHSLTLFRMSYLIIAWFIGHIRSYYKWQKKIVREIINNICLKQTKSLTYNLQLTRFNNSRIKTNLSDSEIYIHQQTLSVKWCYMAWNFIRNWWNSLFVYKELYIILISFKKKLNDYSVVYHFFIFRTNFSLWLQKALSRHHCTVRTGLRRSKSSKKIQFYQIKGPKIRYSSDQIRKSYITIIIEPSKNTSIPFTFATLIEVRTG